MIMQNPFEAVIMKTELNQQKLSRPIATWIYK